MSAAEIAYRLAGRKAQRLPGGGFLIPCPVPSHGKGRGDRSPSLAIKDGDQRLLVKCHAGCLAVDVLAELRARGLLDDDAPRAEPTRPAKPKAAPTEHEREQAQHRKAAGLWARARPIKDTPVERYLRETRNISRPLPPTIRYLPPRNSYPPAMIAAFAIIDEGEPGAFGAPRAMIDSAHLTLLTPDGRKAEIAPNKIIVGRPLGRPIMLSMWTDSLGLAITEGIEDALSAHEATRLAAWAAGAAGFMPALAKAVPSFVECVTICAHPDKAGQDGARQLAAALKARGVYEVLIEGLAQ